MFKIYTFYTVVIHAFGYMVFLLYASSVLWQISLCLPSKAGLKICGLGISFPQNINGMVDKWIRLCLLILPSAHSTYYKLDMLTATKWWIPLLVYYLIWLFLHPNMPIPINILCVYFPSFYLYYYFDLLILGSMVSLLY